MEKSLFSETRFILVDKGDLKGKILEVFAVDQDYYYIKSAFKNSQQKIPCDYARLIPKECKPIEGDIIELAKKGIKIQEHISKHN